MRDRGFIRGAVWNTLGTMMYGANSFLMLALVSRIGTVEDVGDFGIAFTTAQLLYIVGLFGVSHYQQTDYQEKYSFSTYARVKIISCILMLLICMLSVWGMRFTHIKALYTIFLTLLMMLNAAADMFQSLFFQKNRLDLSGKMLFYRTLWSFCAFALAISVTKNILISVGLQICVNLIVTIYYSVRYTHKMTSDGKKLQRTDILRDMRLLIMECMPLFISLFLMNVVINISKYGVDILLDDAAQGYYNMIFISVQIINLCSPFLFKPFLNRYADVLSHNKWEDFRSMLKMQLSTVAVFTVSCCFAAFFFGTQILGLIYNKDLSRQKNALVLLILGGGVFTCGQLFYYIYVVLRLQKQIMCIYIVGLVSSVILAGVFINYLGLEGAAISFLLTQGILLLCYVIFLIKIFKAKEKAGGNTIQ